MTTTSNFGFLAEHSPLLAELGLMAERLCLVDPPSCVLRLRLMAEAITQDLAARFGIAPAQQTQAELLRAVDARLGLEPQVRQLFVLLRRSGNAAAHQLQHGIGDREGLDALRVARELAIWFHRSFGPDQAFDPEPFQFPVQPPQGRSLDDGTSQRQAALQQQFEARLQAQSQGTTTAADLSGYSRRATEAARQVVMDEAATRQLIDLQLNEAGWQADTRRLSYASGARPERNQFRAIPEWPVAGQQSADYLLFAGLTPIAVVEAKRLNVNVAGKISQAERYARHALSDPALEPAWKREGRSAAWPDGQGAQFPFPSSTPATAGRWCGNWPKPAVPGSGMCARQPTRLGRCRGFTVRRACRICWRWRPVQARPARSSG